ncbi:hypothetical protein BV22DRAFT_1129071 [Leucogyrophana mollusca]|uniref:Uncharacterized protein n=1 Tax=Leucogyrophana mollusca TaxID=85980 RepID=A0ACB8BI79_9AGAM|nr:hypothetical protein BV22DRAFT_1129071 [Leucogyrophana mollusca]
MPNPSNEKSSRVKSKTIQQLNDQLLKDAKATDIIIPIMGPTGVGKSTFINCVVGRDTMLVGNSLESCTSSIQHVVVPYPNNPARRVVFVDTPSFDNTSVDDLEILRRIALWLAQSYSDKMKLAGVIYLHDISQTRMFGTSRKSLTMFRRLCGDDALKNVIIATTKWSEVDEDVGVDREKELARNFWQEVIDHGSRMAQFRDTRDSAWDIVDLVAPVRSLPLQIQTEVVDLGKPIPETDAAHALRPTQVTGQRRQ